MGVDKDTAFGRLALDRGYVTPEQLAEAVEDQRVLRSRGLQQGLAQILFTKGRLNKNQVKELRREVSVQTGEARLVGGFEVLAEIGRGGMGVVYKARRTGTDELVALKVLPRETATEELIARFEREVKIVARLRHPNIVGCREWGFDDKHSCHYCALEFVEGEDLGKIIEGRGVLPEAEAVAIVWQIAQALQHAHDNGLVHRDVKPENIMVTADGTAKLLDLGLARPTDPAATRFTQTGMVVGSVYYVSPEQVTAGKTVDIRADVYSLGATLYHMVTGRVPYDGVTTMEILSKHANESLVPPGEINPNLSPELCAVIDKMLEKDREERQQTPGELLGEFSTLPYRVQAPTAETLSLYGVGAVPAASPRDSGPRSNGHYDAVVASSEKVAEDSSRARQEGLRPTPRLGSPAVSVASSRHPVSGIAWWRTLPLWAKVGTAVTTSFVLLLAGIVGLAMILAMISRRPDWLTISLGRKFLVKSRKVTRPDLRDTYDAKKPFHVAIDARKALDEEYKTLIWIVFPTGGDEETTTLNGEVDWDEEVAASGRKRRIWHWTVQIDEPGYYVLKVMDGEGNTFMRKDFRIRTVPRTAAAPSEGRSRDKGTPTASRPDAKEEAETALKRAHDAFKAKDYERVIAECNKVLDLDPSNADAYSTRGLAKSMSGDREGWREDHGRAVVLKHGEAGSYYLRAYAKDRSGDQSGAIADYTKAIQIAPDFCTPYYYRAYKYLANGDHDRALADFTKCIQLEPDNPIIYYHARASAYRAMKDWGNVIGDLRKVIALEPGFKDAYLWRGHAYFKTGDCALAVADFSKVIDLDPLSAEAYYWRAKSWDKRDNPTRAIEDLSKAIDLRPNDPLMVGTRGSIYERRGLRASARNDYKKVVELDPGGEWGEYAREALIRLLRTR